MKKNNKELFNMVATLLIIGGIIGALLGFVNFKTKDIIAKNKEVSAADLKVVAKDAQDFEKLELVDDTTSVKEVFLLKDKSGTVIGHLFKVSPKGYKGNIDMLVAIDKDSKIIGSKIMNMVETPGVGDKINNENFIKQYINKDAKSSYSIARVVEKDSDIAGISGATFSSNGFNKGINDAVSYFNKVVKGEVVEEKKIELTPEVMKLSGDKMEKVEGIIYNDLNKEVYKVTKSGEITGYIIVGEADGYHMGVIIKTAVGLDIKNNVVTNAIVVEQNETPGLGEQIKDEKFTNQFQGKSFDAILNVNKLPVDVVTGATGSSEGTVFSVRDAIRTYMEKIKK